MTVQELQHQPKKLFFSSSILFPRVPQPGTYRENIRKMANILFLCIYPAENCNLRAWWIDQRDYIWTTVFDPFFNLLMLLVPAGTCGSLLWSGGKISSSLSVSGIPFLGLGICLAWTTSFSMKNITICADHISPSLFPLSALWLSQACDDPITVITLLSAVQEDPLPTKHCHQVVGTTLGSRKGYQQVRYCP